MIGNRCKENGKGDWGDEESRAAESARLEGKTLAHAMFTVKHGLAIKHLLNLPVLHKRRAIGHMRDHVRIMAHQQIGHTVLLFQAVE